MQNKQNAATKTLNVFTATLLLVSVLSCPLTRTATAAEAAPKEVPTSEDTQALKELLQGCDDSLTHQQNLNKLKDSYIDTQAGQIEALSKRDKDAGGATILNNPLVFFLLGMGATALTVHLVKP